jgi:hypothetical protein
VDATVHQQVRIGLLPAQDPPEVAGVGQLGDADAFILVDLQAPRDDLSELVRQFCLELALGNGDGEALLEVVLCPTG